MAKQGSDKAKKRSGKAVFINNSFIDNDIGVKIFDSWINCLNEIVDAFVLESDAVEHSHRRLSHTGIVVALARMQRRALHDNAAQLVKGHEILKLKAIAEGARGGHHGILQPQ